jgi:hypothetical protein
MRTSRYRKKLRKSRRRRRSSKKTTLRRRIRKKTTRKRRGGSASTPTITSFKSYGFDNGNSARSEAANFQKNQDTTQQDLINTHGGAKRKRGGSAEGLAPLEPAPLDVPQFPQQGPSVGPQNANNTSVATNTSAVAGTVNATNDCYATKSCGTKGGGKRTRRAGKRGSRRGGKRVTWGCMS